MIDLTRNVFSTAPAGQQRSVAEQEQSISILIVEDEGIVAQDLLETVTQLGYRVAGIATEGAEAVSKTIQLQPDLIVILGDYMSGEGWMSHRMNPEVFCAILKDLHAPLGVYSVLGNHDWWWDGRRVRSGLEANGIRVLDDEVTELSYGGRQFWLAGLADLWTRPQRIAQTIAKIPEGLPIIALTHNPDIFPRLPQRVNLLMAGHTHGGQVRFPIIGTVIQPSDFGQKYVRGHVYENGHHLFVTTGIGTSILPVRFGVTPEIVLLTLSS